MARLDKNDPLAKVMARLTKEDAPTLMPMVNLNSKSLFIKGQRPGTITQNTINRQSLEQLGIQLPLRRTLKREKHIAYHLIHKKWCKSFQNYGCNCKLLNVSNPSPMWVRISGTTQTIEQEMKLGLMAGSYGAHEVTSVVRNCLTRQQGPFDSERERTRAFIYPIINSEWNHQMNSKALLRMMPLRLNNNAVLFDRRLAEQETEKTTKKSSRKGVKKVKPVIEEGVVKVDAEENPGKFEGEQNLGKVEGEQNSVQVTAEENKAPEVLSEEMNEVELKEDRASVVSGRVSDARISTISKVSSSESAKEEHSETMSQKDHEESNEQQGPLDQVKPTDTLPELPKKMNADAESEIMERESRAFFGVETLKEPEKSRYKPFVAHRLTTPKKEVEKVEKIEKAPKLRGYFPPSHLYTSGAQQFIPRPETALPILRDLLRLDESREGDKDSEMDEEPIDFNQLSKLKVKKLPISNFSQPTFQ